MFHLLTLAGAPYGPEELACSFLEDYELSVSIGIHGFEKAAPQRLIINIALFTRPGAEGVDEIACVVDYDFLREEIAALCASRHFNLQETVCAEIVKLCLAKPAVLGAAVSTKKPDVYADARAVGVEMMRWKKDAD